MVGEYKTLGELVQSDPALKNRVVVAKVGGKCPVRCVVSFGSGVRNVCCNAPSTSGYCRVPTSAA